MVILKTRAKNLFLTIFSVAVLAFGFGALNVPEAEAVEEFTVTANRVIVGTDYTVQMCTNPIIEFTVNEGASPIDGAAVTLNNEWTGCTTVLGKCSISKPAAKDIIKGDIIVTAVQGSKNGTLTLKAVKRENSETTCNNNCNDDMDAAGADCADTTDCPAKTACKTSIGAAGKCVAGTCNASTETFSTISADKASISVGSSVIVTFTANIDGVRIKPAVILLDSSTFAPSDCVTGGESPVNPKKCSITVTPISAGSITFTATKTSDATQTIIIPVNASDALKITTPVKTVTVGKAVDVDFVVRDNGSNALPDATVSASGAGMAEAEKKCTTDDSGKCSIALYAASAGTITVKAVSGALTPGSIAIQAVSSSSTGGTGVGGLTTASLSEIIGRMIDWLLSVAAGLAVLFMIIGGVYYVTAAGNDTQIETAKKMIAYSIIGLVFVIVSYSIVVTINSVITG